MNRYKVDFYALSKHSVMIVANSKEDAIDFAKEIFLRTKLIDLGEDEKEAIFIEANLYNEQIDDEDMREYNREDSKKDSDEECDKGKFKLNKNICEDDDELRLRVVKHQTTNEIHYEATCPICHKIVSVDKLIEDILG